MLASPSPPPLPPAAAASSAAAGSDFSLRALAARFVAIFEEYRRFAGSKARVVDQHFIERFQPSAGAARAGALPRALPARALEAEPEGVEPGGAG